MFHVKTVPSSVDSGHIGVDYQHGSSSYDAQDVQARDNHNIHNLFRGTAKRNSDGQTRNERQLCIYDISSSYTRTRAMGNVEYIRSIDH
jgi:hypothetical protein